VQPVTSGRKNPRIVVLSVALLVGAIALLAREHRPSFLRPGLRLNAYITTADGGISVVDLVRLRAIARVFVGPALSGLREHPTRPEVWGVSTQGGYIFVLDARSNQIAARLSVGAAPFALDFSGGGDRIYTTSSGSDTLLAIDCQSRTFLGRARTGRQPVLARITPDGRTILVVNHGEASLGIHDGATLAERIKIPVVSEPDDVAILPDSSEPQPTASFCR
jgi:DNA-binding beta-propeller fold protein YncE